MKSKSKSDIIERLLSGYTNALLQAGVHEKRLAQQLGREMGAQKASRIKVRGQITDKDINGDRVRIVASSTQEGEYGETVLEFQEELWSIQQQARQDAQKLLDLYPAERHQVDVDKNITVVIREFKDSEPEQGKTSANKQN